MKKQKDKSKKLSSSQRQEDQQHAREESTEHAAAGHRESSLDPNHDQENTASHSLTEDAEPSNIAGSGEPTPTLPKQTHNRQPSLSVESKLRSSSFRRTSVSQAPLSPPLNGNKSPILPILTTDGESVNEIYRKQTAKLDELEKENRRLAKEIRDVELRWQKTEEELEDLRESSSEVAELKSRAGKADSKAEENEKLVSF